MLPLPGAARPRTFPLTAAAVIALGLTAPFAAAHDEFEGWHLEPGVSQAHLVMVARVASISRVTIVEGAKTETALREYRFEPIRRLKGIFQRDRLSMTAADLGLPAETEAGAPPLREGEFRLLILTQQQGRAMGCVSAAPGAITFAERVPSLSGPDDPLVGVVETLISVADSRSRRERAALLVKRLERVSGLAAVPLLSSLGLRADWAAADDHTLPALTRLVRDPSMVVRGSAIEVLRDVLAARSASSDPRLIEATAAEVARLLESEEAVTRVRIAALETLGHLLSLEPGMARARDLLLTQMTTARTFAERTAAAQAVSRGVHPKSAGAVLAALAALPLDEDPAREAVYIRAALSLDAPKAEAVLLSRLDRSVRARQSLGAKVDALGRIRSKASLPLLLVAAGQPAVSHSDLRRVAWALGRLGDDKAVPVLAGWLRGEDYQLKESALAALETLDSDLAARESRPRLKPEAHLPYKLRIARLIARHGFADGYSLATEHLADVAHMPAATLVLAALKDGRTAKDLTAILTARPDRKWHAAALSGLAATGDANARRQLLAILADDRNPLAVDAAEAAGLSGDADLLAPLATLARSRNRQLALASLTALRRFFVDARTAPLGLAAVERDGEEQAVGVGRAPVAARTTVFAAVAALALDSYVDADVRQEAFAVARLVRGDKYAKLLADVADQSELEGTPLLAAVEAERRRRK